MLPVSGTSNCLPDKEAEGQLSFVTIFAVTSGVLYSYISCLIPGDICSHNLDFMNSKVSGVR